jgi:site-specific recombinase XerD
MKQYNQYLQSKQLSQATVRIYEKYTNHFINHITEENKQAPEVKYSDILAFIEHLRDEGKSTGRINIYLTAIRHYYEYLNMNNPSADGSQSGRRSHTQRGETETYRQTSLKKKNCSHYTKTIPIQTT